MNHLDRAREALERAEIASSEHYRSMHYVQASAYFSAYIAERFAVEDELKRLEREAHAALERQERPGRIREQIKRMDQWLRQAGRGEMTADVIQAITKVEGMRDRLRNELFELTGSYE